MSNTRCTICDHPERAAIEAAHVAGVAFRKIGAQFKKSKTTIARHIRLHMASAAQKAAEAANDRELEAGTSVLDELRALSDRATRLLAKAEKDKDGRLAIAALRELARHLELKARLLGELREREISITNVQLDPETQKRMAEMFLARREPAILVESTEEEGQRNE